MPVQATSKKIIGADRVVPQLLSWVPRDHIREIRLDQDLSAYLEGWRKCNSNFYDHTIHCDPDWIEASFKWHKENVHICFLERDRQVIGAVPFMVTTEPLLCRLGPFSMANLPLRRLRTMGNAPNMPAETSTYDMLFEQLLQSEFDAIQLDHVRTPSLLWNYLHTSPMIHKAFSFYTKSGPLPHPLIRIGGSFESYIKQRFSSKARKNRFREINILRALGDLQCIPVTKASEIDEFLEAACAIAKKTWQFARYGWGIGGRNINEVRNEMQFLAERGWLRSYLLKCGTEPCSFVIGQQYGGTFYVAAAGVDSTWKSYSAGTVLFMLTLEDLFRQNSPRLYDLDSYDKYKEHFANDSYLEASVWLFRRRAYPSLVSSIYRILNATSKKAGLVLNQLQLKSSVQRLLMRRLRK